MTTVSRFAPSPTGLIHVGNLRTALFNYLVCRQQQGKFILRFDDTDGQRSSEKFVEQTKRDLDWVGINWDQLEKQSERIEHYKNAAKLLIENGLLYECFESPEELNLKRKTQLAMGKPPVYDRAALKLSDVQKKELRDSRRSHWRFKLNRLRVEWTDQIMGLVGVETGSVSDPVLIRGDGQFLYTLASVVDDISFKVNYIIRGADHVTNTATQIQLFDSLGGETPKFAHHSLLVGSKGEPLSKRLNDLSLLELKKCGLEPAAVFSFMSYLGSSDFRNITLEKKDIIENFSIKNFSSNHTKFDFDFLKSYSKKYLAKLPISQISEYLEYIGVPNHMAEDFWEMARENVSRKSDLSSLLKLCLYGTKSVIPEEDKEFINRCKELLPPLPRDKTSWRIWTDHIKIETNRSGKSLFLPLRLALTGKPDGPDMNKLFPLLQKIKI